MKRDMDLIRSILLAVEDSKTGYALRKIVVEGHSEAEIGYHSYLICDAGLATGVDVTTHRSESPEWHITKLTWAGHEFIESARPQTRWNEVKSMMNKVGGAAIAVWQKVLTDKAVEAVSGMIS